MDFTDSLLCFEVDSDAHLHAEIFPSLKDRIFSMEGLVTLLSGAPAMDSQARLQYASNHLAPSGEGAQNLLCTLETLRESGITTHEDVDYSFGECLTETPKTQSLRAAFHTYLDSPLAKDAADRTAQCIERLRHAEEKTPGSTYFVRACVTRPLFTELARAFSLGREEVRVIDPWEAPSRRNPRRRPRIFKGAADTLIPKLASNLQRKLSRGRSLEDSFVLFQGSPAESAWLKFQLDRSRLPYHFLGESTQSPDLAFRSNVGATLERLRADNSIALRDRIHWSALVLELLPGVKHGAEWARLIEILFRVNKIDESTKFKLLQFTEKKTTPPRPDVPREGVKIVPFYPLLLSPSSQCLAYASSHFFDAPTSSLLLKREELLRLQRAGFTVPTEIDRRTRLRQVFEAVARDRQTLLFSSLEENPGYREVRLSSPVLRTEKISDDRYRVPLPVKRLSATQLEGYTRCPSQYLFGNRIRLRRAGPLSESSFPLLLGQTTHLALETYFKGHPQPIVLEDMTVHFDRAVASIAPALEADHPLVLRLKTSFEQFASRIHSIEAQLVRIVGSHTPHAFELPFTLTLEGVTVTGKIDRVDQLPSGELLILDYKTGTVDFTPDHIAQAIHFQALLYLLAAEATFPKPCAGILFYDLKKGELRRGVLRETFMPPAAKKEVTRGHILTEPAFHTLRDQGLEALRRVADKIASGDFHPTPSSAICARCDYPALCRKAEGYA